MSKERGGGRMSEWGWYKRVEERCDESGKGGERESE